MRIGHMASDPMHHSPVTPVTFRRFAAFSSGNVRKEIETLLTSERVGMARVPLYLLR